jgi:hypothetical protein
MSDTHLTDPRFLLKYATRGRPLLLLQRLRDIVGTITTNRYTVFVTFDDDDATMTPEVVRAAAGMGNVVVQGGVSESKIHAINRGLEAVDGSFDVLVCMSDDMRPMQRGWNEVIVQRANETWPGSLDWFAHFSDGTVGAALATMSIMGRDYFVRDRYIYHPCYRAFSCDAEAMFVAMMRGRHAYFPEVLFRHEHPANLPMPTDATYQRNDGYLGSDAEVYFERRRHLFYVEDPTCIPFDPAGR